MQNYSLDDLSSQPALVSLFVETLVKPQLPPCLIELDYVHSVFRLLPLPLTLNYWIYA